VARAQADGKSCATSPASIPQQRRIDVGPVAVDPNHPAAQLRGAGSSLPLRPNATLILSSSKAPAPRRTHRRMSLAHILAVARKI